MMRSEFIPSVGQWLYATCSAEFYGEIVAVGHDANGQPTVDIRLEHPDDIIDCESVELGETAGPDEWENPLTRLDVPEGVKLILRDVLWRARGVNGSRGDERETLECNTPGNNCYRCTKYFWVHSAEQYATHWSHPKQHASRSATDATGVEMKSTARADTNDAGDLATDQLSPAKATEEGDVDVR